MFAFLIRILMIFMAISVVRSVVQAIVRMFQGQNSTRRTPPASQTAGNTTAHASDSTLLHQDPVCGTYVAAASSLRKICNGKVYHFCSDACRDKYNS